MRVHHQRPVSFVLDRAREVESQDSRPDPISLLNRRGKSENQRHDQSAKISASGFVVVRNYAVFPPGSVELLDENFIQNSV